MANDQLIDEVISSILFNKEMHEQATWAEGKTKSSDERPDFHDPECGATACIAGWACILTGQLFNWTLGHSEESGDGTVTYVWQACTVGDKEEIQDVARQELELSYDEAQMIFNTMDEDAALDLLKRVKNGEEIVEAHYNFDYEEPDHDYSWDGEGYSHDGDCWCGGE